MHSLRAMGPPRSLPSSIVSRSVSSAALDTPKAAYPLIHDLSPRATKARERESLAGKYRKLKTVEEKLFAVNLPRYYGWNSLHLKEGESPYNYLPFVQYSTRSLVNRVDMEGFYKLRGMSLEETGGYVERLRPLLQEALLFELKGKRRPDRVGDELPKSSVELADELAESVFQQINSILLTNLSSDFPHLMEATVDYKPRLEAFWLVGGFHPSEEMIEEREKEKKTLTDEEKKAPVEHWIQYLGRPSIQVRSSLPLEILDTDVATAEDDNITKIPVANYDPPLTYGIEKKRRFGTNIPGFWPGDKNEFGLLSYHSQSHLLGRPPNFGEQDRADTLCAQATLAAFSWLHSQACYQGFNTFEELTYPLVSQNILSDGRNFSFFLYQLNTTLLHSDFPETNPRVNRLFALPEQPLFQELKNNEFVGWNDNVLNALVSFYVNRPSERETSTLKPHVDQHQKYLSEIPDDEDERREWLHKQFRHMYSNRPRHRLEYEIYDWERIYKIKFETRPMEARSRPFERGVNPLEDRKYYEHMHAYIPRKFRPRNKHWTGWRAKFAKTYYPDDL